MDKTTLTKLARLLAKFPEVWNHTIENVDSRSFHHVDYKSVRGTRPKVRLVSHVSGDMCDLLVLLKNHGPELVELARASLEPEPRAAAQKTVKARKGANAA